jgi:hypothetical protein
MESPFDEVCFKSPQFQELSHLAARYRGDIERFRALHARLVGDAHLGDSVEIGAELAMHGLLEPHRLEHLIATPIQRDVEDFVKNMTASLAQTEFPKHTSAKVARHGIHEFQLQHTVSEVLGAAVVRALLDGGDFDGAITSSVVRTLDDLWVELCTPLVAGECKALETDLPAVRKLAAFVLRLVQMRNNDRSSAAIYTTAKAEFSGIRHTLHRVTNDAWFRASTVPVAPLAALRVPPADDDEPSKAFAAFAVWVGAHGRCFHDALVADAARMAALASTSEFHAGWHGMNGCLKPALSAHFCMLLPFSALSLLGANGQKTRKSALKPSCVSTRFLYG